MEVVYSRKDAFEFTQSYIRRNQLTLNPFDVIADVQGETLALTAKNIICSISKLKATGIVESKKSCIKCNKKHPFTFFRINKKTGNTGSVCKICRRSYSTTYKLKEKANGRWTHRKSAAQARYKAKNPDKEQARAKAKGARHRATLSDNYIKFIIKKNTGLDRKEITKEMIAEKRLEIAKKRVRSR